MVVAFAYFKEETGSIDEARTALEDARNKCTKALLFLPFFLSHFLKLLLLLLLLLLFFLFQSSDMSKPL